MTITNPLRPNAAPNPAKNAGQGDAANVAAAAKLNSDAPEQGEGTNPQVAASAAKAVADAAKATAMTDKERADAAKASVKAAKEMEMQATTAETAAARVRGDKSPAHGKKWVKLRGGMVSDEGSFRAGDRVLRADADEMVRTFQADYCDPPNLGNSRTAGTIISLEERVTALELKFCAMEGYDHETDSDIVPGGKGIHAGPTVVSGNGAQGMPGIRRGA